MTKHVEDRIEDLEKQVRLLTESLKSRPLTSEPRPPLSTGQIWRHQNGQFYLAVTLGIRIILFHLSYDSEVTNLKHRTWAGDTGFSDEADKFTYLGMIKSFTSAQALLEV
jgi:hypothetical protein